MGRIARSFAITRESLKVLRSDKSLVLFPIISGAATAAVSLTFIIPIAVLAVGEHITKDQITSSLPWTVGGLLVAFLFYFVNYAIATYCNVALVGCAMERFEGRPTSVSAGFRIANQRLGPILAWSAVAATVGMILRALEERAGLIGRIVIGLIGLAWTLATLFVIPVLVMEGIGPIAAMKRSVQIIKKSWGESIVAYATVGLATGLVILLIVLLTVGACIGTAVLTQSWILPVVIGTIGVLAIIAVAVVGSTLKEILNAALYRYATTGVVPAGYTAASLQGVFAPKK